MLLCLSSTVEKREEELVFCCLIFAFQDCTRPRTRRIQLTFLLDTPTHQQHAVWQDIRHPCFSFCCAEDGPEELEHLQWMAQGDFRTCILLVSCSPWHGDCAVPSLLFSICSRWHWRFNRILSRSSVRGCDRGRHDPGPSRNHRRRAIEHR